MQVLARAAVYDDGAPSTRGAGTLGVYTDQQVTDLINCKHYEMKRTLRASLLTFSSLTWAYKADLSPWITSCTVEQDSTRDVQRTATLTMAETASTVTTNVINGLPHYQSNSQLAIDYWNDWVQIIYRLGTGYVDPTHGDEWLEFSLGCFMFQDPVSMLTGFMVGKTAKLADASFAVSQVQATTADTVDSSGQITQATYAKPINIPETDPSKLDGSGNPTPIKLIDLITALLCNPPNPNVPYDGGDPGGHPLATLPGVGLDVHWLDANVFFPGGAIYQHLSAVVPVGGYTYNPGDNYLTLINSYLEALNCDPLWVTEGAICLVNGVIGVNEGAQWTRNGLSTGTKVTPATVEDPTIRYDAAGTETNSGPLFTTQRWPTNQNYSDPSVYPFYCYSTTQDTDIYDGRAGHSTGVQCQRLDQSSSSGYPVLHFTDSIVLPGTSESLNQSAIANVVNIVIEGASTGALVVALVNNNPASPISLASSPGKPAYRRITRVVTKSGVPIPSVDPVTSTATDWALGIAHHEMLLATGASDTVTLQTAPNPAHQSKDVVLLNIYADYVQNGVLQHQPIVIGDPLGTPSTQLKVPGIDLSQKFLQTGWSFSFTLPTPGSGHDIPSTGLTTGIANHEAMPGAVMTHTLIRVTSITPDGVYKNSQTAAPTS